MPACMNLYRLYCFTYLVLILCKYLYQCIYMVTQNRQYLMDGLSIFSLNMPQTECTYNPGVAIASTHCVQQLCEISASTII